MASNNIDPIGPNGEVDIAQLPWKDRIQYRIVNGVDSLRLFIYNKEHQTIFGATSDAWFKISLYYLLFYICLGLFYCGMIAIFAAIISRESPQYTYRNSELRSGKNVYIGTFFSKKLFE